MSACADKRGDYASAGGKNKRSKQYKMQSVKTVEFDSISLER
jgi:hypothetical protein